jgi:monovalent cation:H+ antiporter-2, CPA2 family
LASAVDLATYKETLIVLSTAGIVVPAMQRLKLSPVIGYLAAGAALGPFGLGSLAGEIPWLNYVTISRDTGLPAIAELGIVFLMFLIGLELSVQRLVTMRRLVFGLGSLQMASASLTLALVASWFGYSLEAAMIIGASLALSSTAIVVEVLARSKRLSAPSGRATFSVLLFQDLSVIPILVAVSLLAPQAEGNPWQSALFALASGFFMIGVIALLGRYALRPLLRLVAALDSPELFLAAVFLIIIGSGVLSAYAGLSMALGSFVAGLLLADTEYRAAIETLIEPFKGLLLGVFFISVGLEIDLVALTREPLSLVSAIMLVVLVKIALFLPLARAFNLSLPAAFESALLLAPAGEFAFIVFATASVAGILSPAESARLLAVVAFSMVLLPVLGAWGRKLAKGARDVEIEEADAASAARLPLSRALIIGSGRVGRLVSTMLQEHGIPYVLTDRDPAIVSGLRAQGEPVFFGDARQVSFLRKCGLDHVDALIITVNTQAEIDRIIQSARELRPELQIIVRARDAAHAKKLYRLGVTDAVPETIEASLQLSEASLVALGIPIGKVIGSIHEQRDHLRRDFQEVVGKQAPQVHGIRSSRRVP